MLSEAVLEQLLRNTPMRQYLVREAWPDLSTESRLQIIQAMNVEPLHPPDARTVLRVKAPNTADALWSVEQILRAGSCGALIVWSQYAQSSSLRRLHLAAQSSETLFVMVRPLAAAQDASPARLRLALKPSAEGLTVDIVKRRAPSCTEPLAVALQPTPVLLSRHARLSRGSPATGSQRKECSP